MILAKQGEDDIAEGQFCFCRIAADEIGVLRGKSCALQAFFGEKEAGAAIHEQAGRFGQRNEFCVSMMFAACEKTFAADDPFMTHDKVVIKHGWGAATEFGERDGAQLHVDAGLSGEFLAAVMEEVLIFLFGKRMEAL